jgi:hypothetical protein
MVASKSFAIMRWSKLKTEVQAKAATGHNNRQYVVSNADAQAPHPNVEFVNHTQQDYWELANERIKEVVTRTVRSDAIRAMEVILTGSPEVFTRDEQGRAADYSQSQWAQDNLDFLKKTFGEKNIVSCTLHQDEKSPHFHAVVIPITTDNRLSAKELFNPVTMRGYQTAYAEAMQPHGMTRGVEHSQAVHQPMQRMYGQQVKDVSQGAELIQPVAYKPLKVDAPAYLQTSPQTWADKQSERLNEQARKQVEEANDRAEKARSLALENAAARDQVRVLQKQLLTSEELKEAHYAKWQASEGKADAVAMHLAGGEPAPPAWLARGAMLLDQAAQQVHDGQRELDRLRREYEQAEKESNYGRMVELSVTISTVEQGQQAKEAFLGPYVGGARRLAELVAEAAQAQEKADKVVADKLAAQAEEKIRQAREQAYNAFITTAKNGDYDELSEYLTLLAKQKYTFDTDGNGATQIVTPSGIRLPEAAFRPGEKTIGGLVLDALTAREQQAIQREQATTARELTLMNRAFEVYGWSVSPAHLTACIIVPKKEESQVVAQLRASLGTLSAVAHLGVQGEPRRTDDKETIYVKYPRELARQASFCFDQLHTAGSMVYEHTGDQSQREQWRTQLPATPNKTKERSPAKSNDMEIGG